MCDNYNIFCCLSATPMTALEKEKIYDNNDDDILFEKINSELESSIPNEVISLSSTSYHLGNYCTLVSKVNYKMKIALVLIYREEDDKRFLLSSNLIIDRKKYNVITLQRYNMYKLNDTYYEKIAVCNYDM